MASSTVSPSCDPPIIVRDRRRKNFFTIDNALVDSFGEQLKAHGLAVYMALARFANQDGACWPSLSTIAKRTGMSRMQVIREIAKLQELNLIAVEHQRGAKGEPRANLYILLDIPGVVTDSDQGSHTPVLGVVTDSDHPSHQELPKQHPENKTHFRNKTQRTPSTQIRNNNNTRGQSTPPPDVVVASLFSVQEPVSAATQNNVNEEDSQAILSQEPCPTPPIADDPPAPSAADLHPCASALIAVGMAPKVANRLASRYSRERIEEKLAYLAFLQAEQPNKVQHPLGWLRTAIEEDYAAPDGYASPAVLAEEAAASQRQEAEIQRIHKEHHQQAVAALEYQRQEEARRFGQLQREYGTTQEEIDLWQQLLAEFKTSLPAESYNRYVRGTMLLSLRNGEALIGLSDHAARDWIENRFAKRIERSLASSVGVKTVTVTFVDLVAD